LVLVLEHHDDASLHPAGTLPPPMQQTPRRYSGRDKHHVHDDTRDAFARQDFQVLVSTDAGNEGIDLQTAHVLVNYNIPWSLVRLEHRMGRIHCIGQARDVELYNLIAADTREGEV
jgi:SNF2 family DNA or RNA helicase